MIVKVVDNRLLIFVNDDDDFLVGLSVCCVNEVFKVYRMDYPDYEFYDTLSASRKHFGCGLVPDKTLKRYKVAKFYHSVSLKTFSRDKIFTFFTLAIRPGI